MSGYWRVPCPTCGAKIHHCCRARTSGRATDTHKARIDAAYPPLTRSQPSGDHEDRGDDERAGGGHMDPDGAWCVYEAGHDGDCKWADEENR